MLDVRSLPNNGIKALALEAAYKSGFTGCILPEDPDHGKHAQAAKDQFRETLGRNQFLYSDVQAPRLETGDTEFGHVASKAAFLAWQRDGSGPNWLFSIYQNSGNCVDASNVEMKAGLLGVRALDPQFGELFRYLPAFYAYAERGSCGQGWYMGACATVNLRVGWCPAMQIDVNGNRLDFDDENESENHVVSTWCRSGIPQWLLSWTQREFPWQPGAITEFDYSLESIRDLFRKRGQIHHGSNTTSGSSEPNRLTRIGGHAQTAQGGDWSDDCLRWFNDLGVRYTVDDFPVIQHQTWGSGWRGEIADRYWPVGTDQAGRVYSAADVALLGSPPSLLEELRAGWGWGPKPEGAWVCSASQQMRNFPHAYAYLPLLRGVPGEPPDPPAPPVDTHPEISGELFGELVGGRIVIRGNLTLELAEVNYRYVAEPVSATRFRLIPRPSL